jgi:hypothetical protein
LVLQVALLGSIRRKQTNAKSNPLAMMSDDENMSHDDESTSNDESNSLDDERE